MLQKFLGVLLTALVVAGAVGVYFHFAGAVPVSVTTTAKQTTFDVSGDATVNVAPDEAQVTMGVQKSASTVAAAQTQVNQVLKDATTKLKSIGVADSDITTASYNVSPDYSIGGTPNGYVVSASLLVKVHDFTKLSSVLDMAGQLGMNQAGGLSFTLSDTLKAKTMSTARAQAITAAENKASELAKLSGMKLGRIVNVAENQNGGIRMVPMTATLDNTSGAEKSVPPTPVSPGTTAVQVTETLSYETL